MTELRDRIVDIISPHSAGCQDPDCSMCDDAARRADLILAELDADDRHVIEFREDGWTIKHPLACRPDLFNCPVNRVAGVDLGALDGPPVPPGRYECRLNDLGDRLLIFGAGAP